MKILALDTATQNCGAALIDDDLVLAEISRFNRRSHSRHVIDIIDSVCGLTNLEIKDVDGFAVTIGPGSFTGLRIGVSTVKALAYTLKKPVAGVSSLDALAWQCAQNAYLICPLLDARKKEVYFSRYRLKNDELIKVNAEMLAAPREAVRDIDEPCVFVGNAARMYRETILAELGQMANFAVWGQHAIRASTIAFLSLAGFREGKTMDPGLLIPRYIRRPDAVVSV